MSETDPISERRLNISYWFVTNKFLLKNILIVSLIVLIIFFISLEVFLLITNLNFRNNNYQNYLTSIVNPNTDYQNSRLNILPKQLQIIELSNYQNNDNNDIVATIANSNDKWFAKFNYQFLINDGLTEKRRSFIFPDEKKQILDLNVINGDLVTQVKISDIEWEKVLNFESYYEDKFHFEFDKIKYLPALELGVGEKIPISRVSFDVINVSPFNYKDLNFLVFLNASAGTVAVNQVYLSELYSGDTKNLEINFFQKLPNIKSVEIIPEINILDPKSFLSF